MADVLRRVIESGRCCRLKPSLGRYEILDVVIEKDRFGEKMVIAAEDAVSLEAGTRLLVERLLGL